MKSHLKFAWALVLSACCLAAAAKPAAENVLFIIFDDMNDWVGYLSREGRDNPLVPLIPDEARRKAVIDWITPNMDKLASEGVAFTQAHANFPLCGPSRASFLSGKLPTSTAFFSNEQNFREVAEGGSEIVTLPEYLKQQGFLSVEAGKVFHKQRGGQPGPSHPQSDPQSWSVQNVEWCGMWWNFPPVQENGKHYSGNPWRYAPETTFGEYQAKGEAAAVLPLKDRWHNGYFTIDYFADNFCFGHLPGLDDERYARKNRLSEQQTFDYKHAAFVSAFLNQKVGKKQKFKYDAAPLTTDLREGVPSLGKGQRFFMAAGMFLPHDPYITPKSYHDELSEFLSLDDIATGNIDALNAMMYEDEEWALGRGAKSVAHVSQLHQGFVKASKENTGDASRYWRECVFSYLACLKFADDRLGQLMEGLEKSAFADNTAIVLCGDNGLHLGSHEHWSKISLWSEATHVPLIIKAPGVNPGICRETVSLVDLYPTMLDLLGLDAPANAQKLDGTSLMPQLADASAGRHEPVVIGYSTYGLPFCYAVDDGEWRLQDYRNVDGKTFVLYDLENDPMESIDLMPDLEKNPQARAAYERLRRYLDRHLVGKASQKKQ
ncbi:Choline-sulfatase [Pontiella desulfatans]|uniref:Choline-sulfatase n=1 Tax=Pontiella desulfatans TaxID=2750659 RepID=A0A6C2U057_PONDE|nr:sulfatase-like hydrolase/transferase [Pontiella desulfatans]SPS73793.1 sulfatase S1_7 [Kiritimatiellales bacterium]VGO13348.1 Choline-sulfatase [Pontiella desulfatans]